MENLAKQTGKMSLNPQKKLEESFEEYTDREIQYLDKYKDYTRGQLEDEELYEIITKHDFDDEKIKRDLNDYLKLVTKKGEEYGWHEVVKGKSKDYLTSRSQTT
jgi:hypothetical protein